ncbi:MAG TPA: phosphatase PAP2 family protein [Jiangellaceae bacterium]|nr:phosphatase PAP2 family protein [Jiangellaceae bacterium]
MGSNRPAGAGVALAILVVIPLGLLVRAGWEPLIAADAEISDELVIPGRGTDVDALQILTAAGSTTFRWAVLAPLAVWLAWRRQWQLVVFVVAGGALIGGMNEILKSIFDRPRPSYDGTIHAIGYSYPSGHAAGIAATVMVLVVVFWPVLSGPWRRVTIVLAIGFAFVVGYTRVALGVHFASDVIAGWCVGVAWVLLLAVVLQVWPGQPGAVRSGWWAAQDSTSPPSGRIIQR